MRQDATDSFLSPELIIYEEPKLNFGFSRIIRWADSNRVTEQLEKTVISAQFVMFQ
jgi:hypothetical protein